MKTKLIILTDTNYLQNLTLGPGEAIDYRILVFSDIENTHCTIKVFLDNPNSKAHISILGIIHNQKKIYIDGQIIIGSNGSNVSGHLNEEVLIIGNHSFTFTKPVLDVANNAVSASHSAKIHRILKNHLFYLMSRGLSENNANKIIVGGLIEKLFEGNPEIEIIGSNLIDGNKEKIIEGISKIVYH